MPSKPSPDSVPLPWKRSGAPAARASLARWTALLLLILILLLPGCAGPGEGHDGWRVEEIPSPAGLGSAEPHLAASSDEVFLSWLEPRGDEDHLLRVDRWDGESWAGARDVARGADFFVNWADFPSVVRADDGTLVGHWLLRGEAGGYDYGIRTAFSRDGGRSWTRPRIPHDDDTPTEHGFVTLLGLAGDTVGAVWLDGRDYAAHADGRSHAGHPDGPEMSLRFRRLTPGGPAGPEKLLDDRSCDCCQTDAALTSRGLVVVYRDRTAEEVRDISVVRRVDGAWTEPEPVHRDGWVFPACPVNGPALAARGRRAAVAWFTGARDTARVRLAFSDDAGRSFAEPIRIDDGDPMGRVDVVLQPDGTALVAWFERSEGTAELRLRRVRPTGERDPSTAVGLTDDGRSSGFPQMVAAPEGGVLLAWTDARGEETRIRMARAGSATEGAPVGNGKRR